MRPGPLGYVRRALQEAAQAVGVPVTMASPYDHFMHRFHNYLKERSDFQRDRAQDRREFPPGSSRMVFTDVVSHAVIFGQFALEQTYIVPEVPKSCPRKHRRALWRPFCGCTLTNDRRWGNILREEYQLNTHSSRNSSRPHRISVLVYGRQNVDFVRVFIPSGISRAEPLAS